MPPFLREITERMLRDLSKGDNELNIPIPKGKRGNEYPPEVREFAMGIEFYSSPGYDFLREQFYNKLPSPSTVRRWMRVVDGRPGFTKEALITLKRLQQSKQEGSIVCNLCVDEISIHSSNEYVANENRLYGVVSHGGKGRDTDGQTTATHILCFLAVGLNGHFKVPVGYFPIAGLDGKERANILKICLELIHETGVKVRSVTFDGATTNFTMVTELGANFNYGSKDYQPWFPHPITAHQVYCLPDPPHMLKLIRNAVGEKGPLFNESAATIDWQYIVLLHEKQENEGLHLGNKINKRHINFREAKMNVRLAAQVFSCSVSDALTLLQNTEPSFKNAASTAHFCQIVNDAFDILNCRNVFSKNTYQKPINEKNIDFLKNKAEEIIQYISKLKIKNEAGKGTISILNSSRKTGFLGLIVCLQNIFLLYEDVVKFDGMYFLLSYRVVQDHLENFFSAIRSRGGFNDNPTCRQFEAAYKRLLIHAEIKISKKSSVDGTAWNEMQILNCSSAICNKADSLLDGEIPRTREELVAFLGSQETNDFVETLPDHDYCNNTWTLTEYVKYVVRYISGFVVRKIRNEIVCKSCYTSLLANKGNSDDVLIRIKNRGGLIFPSDDVTMVCSKTEQLFRQHVDQMMNKDFIPKVCRSVMKSIHGSVFVGDHFLAQEILNDHKYQLMALIIKTYIAIRLTYECKVRSAPKKYNRRKLHKLIHFTEAAAPKQSLKKRKATKSEKTKTTVKRIRKSF